MNKIIIFIVLIVISITSNGQDSIPELKGVMGVNFKTTYAQAKAELLKRVGTIVDDKLSNKDQLVLKKIVFGGRISNLTMFQFYENKFYSAIIVIEPDVEANIIKLYNSIVNEINNKYYVSDEVKEEYLYPFQKGDEMFETAIKVGKATYTTLWRFKEGNHLLVAITKQMNVLIGYTNKEIKSIADGIESEKNQSDY